MAGNNDPLAQIQQHIWDARLPLEIRLASSESRLYDRTDPYRVSYPRLCYLPALLPQLLSIFTEHLIADIDTLSAETAYFSHEGIPLKWHLPVGLLYDIYVLSTQDVHQDDISQSQRSPVFKLTVHFSRPAEAATLNLINPTPNVVHDSFINSVKEADFLRSGTAKPIMSLSAADSKSLWSSTQDNDLSTYARIHNGLLPGKGEMRNIPLRVFLPSSPKSASSSSDDEPQDSTKKKRASTVAGQNQGQIRVLQSHIPPFLPVSLSSAASTNPAATLRAPPSASSSTPQTLGTALHSLIPSLFPSRRTPILAKPILHGAQVPMSAVLEDLARRACYADGWVNVVVGMTT